MVRVIELAEIDDAEWNEETVWSSHSLVAHLIKHPELISQTARFETLEYLAPLNGVTLRIDIIFEDNSTVYLVECEASRGYCLRDGGINLRMLSRFVSINKAFCKRYTGGKAVENVLVVPLTNPGVNICPCCGKIIDDSWQPPQENKKFESDADRAMRYVTMGEEEGVHRSFLYRKLGIPASSLDEVLNMLIERGEIEKISSKPTGGRPVTLYKLKNRS